MRMLWQDNSRYTSGDSLVLFCEEILLTYPKPMFILQVQKNELVYT